MRHLSRFLDIVEEDTEWRFDSVGGREPAVSSDRQCEVFR